ncbi:MAG: ATP-binding cassette domain-containing protein [Marmoricola sp.]
MAYTVTVTDVTKSFGRTEVLRGVNLAIEEGTVYGLLGPNGAGKTTLVRILATLLRADGGAATVLGRDLARDAAAIRHRIGLTGQYAAVDEVLTGTENLMMMSRLRKLSGRQARHRADELLEEFDLVEARDRRVGTYSGGMKRRLDLAVSMIERPELLFLDEPTTGLDPRSREQVWTTVAALVREGVTILLTTQYLEEADRLAGRIGVLDHGRIIAEGAAEELKATIGAERVRLQLSDAASFSAAVDLLPAAFPDPLLMTLTVDTDGSARALTELLGHCEGRGIQVQRVDTLRPSLDDVFLNLTDRRAVAA